MADPRQYALCKFKDFSEADWKHYPFSQYTRFIYLGEIPNMLGHCVVADHKSGVIYSGYHTENFVELTEDEV